MRDPLARRNLTNRTYVQGHVKNTTWKQFERVALEIQQTLSPEATVTHDEKLVGRSGATHQCDGIIRATLGTVGFTCVIECKDHEVPVGSEIMRAFVGKIVDLQVNHGIVVSTAGFTDDALKLARTHNVSAYRLIDAAHARWRYETLIPLCFARITLQQATSRLIAMDGTQRVYVDSGGVTLGAEHLRFYDTKALRWTHLREILEHLWDVTLDARIPRSAEEVEAASRYLVYSGGRAPEMVAVRAVFTPRITYHYNSVSVEDYRGFVDVDSDEVLPARYETGVLDVDTIIEQWPSVADKDAVPFIPIDFLYVCGFFYRPSRTPRRFTLGRSDGPAPAGAISL